MRCMTICRALFVRVLFAIHGMIAIWRLYMVIGEIWCWYLSAALLGLFIETTVTLIKKRGKEWKWWVLNFQTFWQWKNTCFQFSIFQNKGKSEQTKIKKSTFKYGNKTAILKLMFTLSSKGCFSHIQICRYTMYTFLCSYIAINKQYYLLQVTVKIVVHVCMYKCIDKYSL